MKLKPASATFGPNRCDNGTKDLLASETLKYSPCRTMPKQRTESRNEGKADCKPDLCNNPNQRNWCHNGLRNSFYLAAINVIGITISEAILTQMVTQIIQRIRMQVHT